MQRFAKSMAITGVATIMSMTYADVSVAQSQSKTDQRKNEAATQQPIDDNDPSRAFTPMMVVKLGNRNEIRSPIGGYTRLLLKFTPAETPAPPDNIRDYDREQRSTFTRYFAGKSIARLFSIKATLARPRVAASSAIVSLGYDSNRRAGESFSTDFNTQRVLTPYFRIDADSAINLETSLVVNSTYDSAIASNLIDVVKRAVSLVAPTATLVTSLNKERFQDASQFVDQSIANLLKESIVERATNDFPMAEWAGQPLANVAVWLPIGNEITPGSKPKRGQGYLRLGTWEISSSPTILSIFSDVKLASSQTTEELVKRRTVKRSSDADNCGGYEGERKMICFAYRNLEPQTVVNFPVDAGLSVGQALAGDSGIAAAREKLIADSKGRAENARVLCTLLADKAHMLGFNRYDVAAVLWAYASQSFVTTDAAVALREEANCAPLKIAYGVGLPRGGFAVPTSESVPTPTPTQTPTPSPPPPPAT